MRFNLKYISTDIGRQFDSVGNTTQLIFYLTYFVKHEISHEMIFSTILGAFIQIFIFFAGQTDRQTHRQTDISNKNNDHFILQFQAQQDCKPAVDYEPGKELIRL